ncbi:MAG: Fe-S cluster assembly protein SufD [Xanthomonadaceae bacterium]|nr:Fe-S cluster assembly protein SufD [Xanthomonadaceae bacterium]
MAASSNPAMRRSRSSSKNTVMRGSPSASLPIILHCGRPDMDGLLGEFGEGDALARAENWRYSRQTLRALEQLPFGMADGTSALPQALIERFDWPQTRGRRLVFVNGVLDAAHSDTRASGAMIDRTVDGACAIHFHGDDALHLVFANIPAAAPARWNAALHIRAESGRARLIEQHIGTEGTDVLGALTSDVAVDGGATLQTATLGDLPGSASLYRRTRITLGAGAGFDSTHALCGGRFQRFDIAADLAGEKAVLTARGVFALRGREHVDVHLDVRHAARDTLSDVSWRGVADGRARGILHGAITVAQGADGADARLHTRNLLLSPHAEIDAQPVLEIYADEVKAAHGATVGQLDERALFYLRSRGVPHAAARSLLIAGFCREAFERIDDADLSARLDSLLDAHMPQRADAGE